MILSSACLLSGEQQTPDMTALGVCDNVQLIINKRPVAGQLGLSVLDVKRE